MKITRLFLPPVLISLTCCGGSNTTNPAPQPVVTTIKVTPPSATIQVGTSEGFAAQAYDQNGVAMSNVTFLWSSSDGAVDVSSTGVATAESVGTAIVYAAASAIMGQASVTVTPAPPELTTVVISPSQYFTVNAGEVFTMSATANDQNGAIIQSPVAFSWTTYPTGVVTPDSIQDNAPTGFSQVQFTAGEYQGETIIGVTATFNGKSAGASPGVGVSVIGPPPGI